MNHTNTDDEIGEKGVAVLSELLFTNTSLTKLNICRFKNMMISQQKNKVPSYIHTKIHRERPWGSRSNNYQ